MSLESGLGDTDAWTKDIHHSPVRMARNHWTGKNLHRKPYRGHPTLAAATTVCSYEAMNVKEGEDEDEGEGEGERD